jgi:hypothetical protein
MTNINSFIGIGTGRCGTKTLRHIVNACNGWNVVHEKHLTNWYNPDPVVVRSLIKFLSRNKQGEVSMNLLPLVPKLREALPELKIVHIWRDKKKVVNSFLRNHGRTSRLIKGMEGPARMDALKRNPHGAMHQLAGMPAIFPKFDTDDVVKSYEMYWEYYIEEAHKIDNVYHLYAFDLKENKTLDDLFDYLEIENKDRVYISKRVFS